MCFMHNTLCHTTAARSMHTFVGHVKNKIRGRKTWKKFSRRDRKGRKEENGPQQTQRSKADKKSRNPADGERLKG